MKLIKRKILVWTCTAIFVLPAVLRADYSYPYYCAKNGGMITITKYIGPGGEVAISDMINSGAVVRIENEAFLDCTSLTHITLGTNVTSIGESAFKGCTNLTAFSVNADNPVFSSKEGVLFNKKMSTLIEFPRGKAGNYVIPDCVSRVFDHAFLLCPYLTGITISSNIVSLGRSDIASKGTPTFKGCTSLTGITVQASNLICSSVNGVLFNKQQTILVEYPRGRPGNFTIPESVTNIFSFAFALCTNVTTITIPANVDIIGKMAFGKCENLTGIYFKGNAPNFGRKVFDDDAHLTIYHLPGTAGWSSSVEEHPTAIWDPRTNATAQARTE